MKKGIVHTWLSGWGIIISENGELLWVGYKDVDDEPNERGYTDLDEGSEVSFKIMKDDYPYENMYQTNLKAVHVRTIGKPQYGGGLKTLYTMVVGVTRTNEDGTERQKILRRCKSGEKVNLIREPDNPRDKNAIKICRETGEQIGYIKADFAEFLAHALDSGRLSISRNTVRGIIAQKGSLPDLPRKDKIEIDPELLRRLYNECNGWIQRMHEKLSEQEGIKAGYSTLTRMIRELDPDQSRKRRCDRVPDEPGAEMQHDTSPYTITMGGTKVRVVASLLYFRYSKIR